MAARVPGVTAGTTPATILGMRGNTISCCGLSLLVALAALAGCADERESSGETDATNGGTGGQSDGEPSDAETGASGSTDGASTGGTGTTGNDTQGDDTDDPGCGQGQALCFDVGDGGGPGGQEGGEAEGCQAVDFLFVVDNSGSMALYQDNLVRNFPGFIDGIQRSLGHVGSFHVGVTTTDAYAFNVAGCRDIGSLVVQTGGENSSGAACGAYAAGANYMTEVDDLSQSFSCAATVGSDGHDGERPIAALLETASARLQGPGGCNEGFLRQDSLLVVVMITDEPDGPGDCEINHAGHTSPGTPGDWFDELVALRGGVETNIVMLTLTEWPDDHCVAPLLDGYCETSTLKDFTEMFTHGIVGGICDDYATPFGQAIGVIADACEGFEPVG